MACGPGLERREDWIAWLVVKKSIKMKRLK